MSSKTGLPYKTGFFTPDTDTSPCTNWSAFSGESIPRRTPVYGNNFRFVIAVIGPFGSGKSSMIEYLKAQARLVNRTAKRVSYIDRDIDQDVHTNETYERDFRRIVTSKDYPGDSNLNECSIASAPWQTVHDSLQRSYANVRFKSKNADGLTLQQANDQKIKDAVVRGLNITYETTSPERLEGLFKTLYETTQSCSKYNYIVLAGIAVNSLHRLQSRAIERYKSSKRNFLRPRITQLAKNLLGEYDHIFLPNVEFDVFKKQVQRIYGAAAELVQHCANNKCPGIGIDLLYIFDNTRQQKGKIRWIPIAVVPLTIRSQYLAKPPRKAPSISDADKKGIVRILTEAYSEENTCPVASLAVAKQRADIEPSKAVLGDAGVERLTEAAKQSLTSLAASEPVATRRRLDALRPTQKELDTALARVTRGKRTRGGRRKTRRRRRRRRERTKRRRIR